MYCGYFYNFEYLYYLNYDINTQQGKPEKSSPGQRPAHSAQPEAGSEQLGPNIRIYVSRDPRRNVTQQNSVWGRYKFEYLSDIWIFGFLDIRIFGYSLSSGACSRHSEAGQLLALASGPTAPRKYLAAAIIQGY